MQSTIRQFPAFACGIVLAWCLCDASIAIGQTFTIFPKEYGGALRNPLKGFRPLTEHALDKENRFATITHSYFKWNELENEESDTVEKIRDLCDLRWFGVEAQGIKVIPSIYLDFNEDEKYWPADMTAGDYTSQQFKQRLERLILRLGECWNDDPRVAFVETSIIGLWGEQHSPSPTPEIQKIMGDAFTRAFPNKKFLVRHPNEFTDYEVGYTWGSWAHGAQIHDDAHGAGIERVNQQTGRWKTQPMEGEIAYNWGNEEETLGGSPDKTLAIKKYRVALIDSIRNLHCTGLGWVSDYNQEDPQVAAGAEEVQKAFGYRFVIQQFACFSRVDPGQDLRLTFMVKNTGSAPFYANWPVELSLLDPKDHSPVWRTALKHVDIRDWLSGDDWDEAKNIYRIAPQTYTVDAKVQIPPKIARGEYSIALGIVDPAGLQPAVRFAIENYVHGGRHPLGRIGIGVDINRKHTIDPSRFDDPMAEPRLAYRSPSFPKRSGYLSIPANFDDETEPNNQWIVGTNKTTLNAISDKSWVCYKNFDFREATNHFSICASSGSQGGRVELRLGHPTGSLIGSLQIPGTGDWVHFKNFETELASQVHGVHDLYLVFADHTQHGEYLFDIQSFRFDQR